MPSTNRNFSAVLQPIELFSVDDKFTVDHNHIQKVSTIGRRKAEKMRLVDGTTCCAIRGIPVNVFHFNYINLKILTLFSGDQFEENFTRQQPKKTVTLTRSKTLIISIPGAPSGKFENSNMDCYCAACVKTAEVNQSNQKTPTYEPKDSESAAFDSQEDKSPEVEMLKIYACFDGLTFSSGTANQSVGNTVINKSRNSLIRYVDLRCLIC